MRTLHRTHLGSLIALTLLTVVGAPVVYAQQSNFTYIYAAIGQASTVISLAVPVLAALALAFFLWGLVVFIYQSDDEQGRAAGKQRMVWGLVALFVIVSVWGLVLLLNQITGIRQGTVGITAPQAAF